MEKLYDLSFEHRPGYLYAFVTGEADSLEISVAFWKEILEEARKLNYNKVLTVESFADVINTVDMFMLGHQLGQMGSMNIKVAFVDLNPDHFEQNKFGETVALNRGMVCQIFATETEAEAWLLSK